ncbi:MAG: hypothetical protein ACEQSX_19915, partial [Baekduiaceae bacterium]
MGAEAVGRAAALVACGLALALGGCGGGDDGVAGAERSDRADGKPAMHVDETGGRRCLGVSSTPVRLHYRTPTVGGSSGSPVFDGDSFTLLGVHHAGAADMRRLNGRPGIYAANEGIWIDSIRQAINETASAGAEAFAGGPVRWRGFADEAGPRADIINLSSQAVDLSPDIP